MTPKQRRFVDEYMIDLNATQAAIRAGYSERTAEQLGYQLLQKTSVSEAVAARQHELAERALITEDEIIAGLRMEATRTGEGSSHSARVSAWSWLGKYRQMFTEPDDGKRTPPAINVNIIAAQINQH